MLFVNLEAADHTFIGGYPSWRETNNVRQKTSADAEQFRSSAGRKRSRGHGESKIYTDENI